MDYFKFDFKIKDFYKNRGRRKSKVKEIFYEKWIINLKLNRERKLIWEENY